MTHPDLMPAVDEAQRVLSLEQRELAVEVLAFLAKPG
jgi:hypothetical protein